MPNDLISRDALIDWFRPYGQSDEPIPFESLVEYARDVAPAADVETVRHGQWLSVCGCIVRCDLCRNEAARESNYCPNCGCKMDKEATND